LLDATGAALRPAILWNDTRSEPQCRELIAAFPDLEAVTGNPAMPGFTAPKLLWVRAHEPEIFARTAKVLLPKAYLRYRLTGELTIRDVRREGKSGVVVDVVSPESQQISLFVEGPTPDWALPVPKPGEHNPPGVKRFSFELDGVPPGVSPEGAALKLTLVGSERAYEFNINLN